MEGYLIRTQKDNKASEQTFLRLTTQEMHEIVKRESKRKRVLIMRPHEHKERCFTWGFIPQSQARRVSGETVTIAGLKLPKYEEKIGDVEEGMLKIVEAGGLSKLLEKTLAKGG